MHSHEIMHKSDNFKNGSEFLRSLFRNNTGFKQNHNKINPFHGEDLSNFRPHSETWTRGPNLPNMNTHSSTPPPTATYKMAPKSHETALLTNASPSSNYIENTIRRNRHRSIPPRFEHRLTPSIDKPSRPADQNSTWSPGPDSGRSNSYEAHHNRKRVVVYQGLRTADLSNRNRYAKRENFNHHPPIRGLPAYPRRNPERAHVKDRLHMPPQLERVVKRQERYDNNPISSDTDANGVHVRSNTQNDPRIRGSQGTPPDEEKSFNSEAFMQPLNPPKPRGKPDQFFDEEMQIKHEDNYDVPLPPPGPPEISIVSSKQQDVVQIPDEVGRKKDHGNDTQSFWDETDEINLINNPQNTEKNQAIYHPVRTVNRVENPRISFKQNSGSFFDDDTSTPYTSKSTQAHRSSHHVKQSREHTNRRSDRHTNDKLRRDKRKVSPTPVRLHHVKRSPKKVKYHSHPPHHPSSPSKHRQKDAKITPAALVSHSNNPILKLNTKSHTHIRLKKTVNLADKESEHSSTDDCAEMVEPRKLVIPLPNSPLQALDVITGEEQVSTPAPALVDISEIETVVSTTRNDSQSVEVQEGPCQVINFTPRSDMNRPVRSLEDFLKFRHQSISESSDIGLHIEFVDDYTANSPANQITQAVVGTERATQSNTGMSLLNIESFKPISPKSDLETPDSVFTPGFDSSQQMHTVFSLDRRSPILHPPVYSVTTHNSTRDDSMQCEEESKYVSKHRSVKSMKRRSTRKSKPLKKVSSDNSLCRADGDSSISNNTREVCIPLTRLDMTQYGAKVKGTSQVPENISSKEKQKIKVLPQWKCVLCHRGANESNLGYLYGPYFKTGENLKVTPQPISARKKASRDHDENELWVHAPCALWSPGVFLVSFHLRGLVEAFEGSQSMKCTTCGHNGATLHCEKDGCSNVYHYTCAENINCRFNHDCFQLQCPKHISKLTNSHTSDL